MSQGAVKKKERVREIEGIPGTVTHGFKEQPIIETRKPPHLVQALVKNGLDPETLKLYTMGPCSIFVGQEPAGKNHELLWHLTISCPSRHPTWDEIKVARYRLLPLDICVGMLLPQPEFYVNLPEQDHVMQVWEVRDEREAWTTG
jgi:hypothetical protein